MPKSLIGVNYLDTRKSVQFARQRPLYYTLQEKYKTPADATLLRFFILVFLKNFFAPPIQSLSHPRCNVTICSLPNPVLQCIRVSKPMSRDQFVNKTRRLIYAYISNSVRSFIDVLFKHLATIIYYNILSSKAVIP